jgi:hypothetical protein
MRKFKFGDKVRVKYQWDGNESIVGMTGQIVHVDYDDILFDTSSYTLKELPDV